MIFEFIGLPGSGKSTIFTAAAQKLRETGFVPTTMRMLAKKAMADDRASIGFLRRHEQRASLYGAMAFADQNPALYDLLCSSGRRDLTTTLWNMEMLSHLHFAAQKGLPDQPIFMDEGFLHRGVASFLLSRDMAGFERYLDLIPDSHVVVEVKASLDLAIERAQRRKLKKRVPKAWQGTTEADMIRNLRFFEGLEAHGCDRLRKRGADVIMLDASLPVETTADQLARAVIAAQQTGQIGLAEVA